MSTHAKQRQYDLSYLRKVWADDGRAYIHEGLLLIGYSTFFHLRVCDNMLMNHR